MAIDAQTLLNRSAANGYWKLSDRDLRECLAASAAAMLPPSPVSDWVNRVVKNGGAAPSAGTQTAMTTFVAALKTAGIWAAMRAMCCFVPDNLIAAITPLVHLHGSDPWANHNFVIGDLGVNGLKGNGSTKYLDTGFNAQNDYASATNCGVSICISVLTNSTVYDLGSDPSGVNPLVGMPTGISQAANMWAGTPTSGQMTYFPSANSPAFITANRNDGAGNKGQLSSGNLALGFSAKVTLATNTSTIAAPGSQFVFGQDKSGVLNNPSDRTFSFVAFHDAFTLAQATSLYNAVQALRGSLGGGNV